MDALIGTGIISQQEFRTVEGVLTNPTTATITLRQPNGTLTVFTFGVDGSVTRTATGVYRFTHTPNAVGRWGYLWTGSGVIAYTEEAFVTITPSQVVA